MKSLKLIAWSIAVLLLAGPAARASEADLAIPNLWEHGSFTILGQTISAGVLLLAGSFVICGTLGISLYLRSQIHKLPAHKSMLDVAEIIYQTCKTYLIQQGKFLLMLFVLISCAIAFYLLGFGHAAEFEVTDHTMQELKIKEVPDKVIDKLRPLVGLQ